MNSIKTLMEMNIKQLLEIAKDVNVIGRHNLRKGDLIDAIVSKNQNDTETDTKQLDESVSSNNHLEMDLGGSEATWTNDTEFTSRAEDAFTCGLNFVDAKDIASFPVNLPVERQYKPRTEYIESAKIGSVVAFRVNNKKVISGVIDEIRANEFKVVTKNGIAFSVNKRNIVWVKTGKRWPSGVYEALKGFISSERTV